MAEIQLNNPLTLQEASRLFGMNGSEFGKFPAGFLGVHNLLHVQEQRPAGTAGGDFTAGAWRTRELNTIIVNRISGSSITNYQILLAPGEYYAFGMASAYKSGAHFIRLHDITHGISLLSGFGGFTNAGDSSVQTTSFLIGGFESDAGMTIELQHVCQSTCSTYGLGVGADIGQDYNLFADLKIWKLS